jgi:5-methylcytosine-specific restriction endonuclease McrA
MAQLILPFYESVKNCSRCHQIQDLNSFPLSNKKTGRRSAYCVPCNKAYLREYYDKHRSTFLAKAAAARAKDPEGIREWKRNHYVKNKTTINAKNQQRKDANRDAVRASARSYYQSNRERLMVVSRSRKACRRGAIGRFTLDDLRAIFRSQCGQCFWCAIPLSEYHCDHYIPISKGGTNDPSNIVLACPRCNLRKRDKMPTEFRNWLRKRNEING